MDKNIIIGDELEKVIDSNLGELFYVVLQSYAENVLQIDGATGEELTGDVLLRKAIRVSEFLKQHGIGVGDSVSIMSENRLEFCLVPIAAFFVGATFAPLNPDYTPGELNHVINLSKPKVVFASSNTIVKLTELRKHLPYLKQLVLFGSSENNNSFIGFNNLIKGSENVKVDEFEVPPYDPKETVATILCSSGTTGMPKGVMCTHDNMTTFFDVGRIVYSRIMTESLEGDFTKTIGIIPFFHSFGFMTMILNMLQGKTMIIMNKFKPKMFLDIVVKYQVNRLMVPPPILLVLVKGSVAQNYDLSCVKEVIVGAAPMSKETEAEIKKKFKIRFVSQAFGMTETTLSVTASPIDSTKLGSVGVIVPGMMAKIIDEDGNALGPFQEGELCLKGPLIMKGYVGDSRATNDCIDKDKWLHTGDVAYYDDEKYFFIVDRLKELIKYKGYQVPPAELEGIINTHPAVMDVAVIGLPDEYAGELPLAFVVKKKGIDVTEDDIRKFVAGKVSPQKQLHGGVRFIKSIPRNPTGKILRRILKQNAIKTMKSKL